MQQFRATVDDGEMIDGTRKETYKLRYFSIKYETSTDRELCVPGSTEIVTVLYSVTVRDICTIKYTSWRAPRDVHRYAASQRVHMHRCSNVRGQYLQPFEARQVDGNSKSFTLDESTVYRVFVLSSFLS